MDLFKNRIESFTRPKRAKGAPNSKSNQKWPHPESFSATPETLAEAGFYFDPSPEDKDNVSCYMCGKELAEWAEDDDPFEIHFKKCGKKCAWANLRCGLRTEMDPDGRFVITDKNRLPTSKPMEKSRLETFLFGDGWIHDQERNHGASSKKMAKAGFVYTPQDPNDDTAVCLYCGISLSGWDADDDPTEEHRKRVKKAGVPCPMFPDIVFAPPPSKASKSHSRSKSKSSHVDVTIPLASDNSDDDAFSRMGSVASSSTAKTPKTSRAVKKGAKTPGSRSVSKSRNVPVLDDDEEPEEWEQARPASRTRKPSTTTRSRSVSRTKSVASLADSDAGTGTEDEVALNRSTRSRGKSRDTGRGTDEESSTAKKKVTKTRSKSKTRVSVIPENISPEDGEPAPPPPKSTKKPLAKKPSTRKLATAKSTSSVKQKQHTEEDDDEDDSDITAPLPAKKLPKPVPASVAAAAALFDDDDDEPVKDKMEVDEPEPLTARPTRATRKSTRPPPQDDLKASTTRKRGTHSRTASTASRGGKSRTPSHAVEEAYDDDPLDVMSRHIPPPSTPSVEPEAEVVEQSRQQKAEGSTAIERKPSKSKAKQKPPPTAIQTDISDQHTSGLAPPPIPPRSPSRPKSKSVPQPPEPEPEPDMEVDTEVISEESKMATGTSVSKPEVDRKIPPPERQRTTSGPKTERQASRSTAESSRPRSTRGESSSSVASKPNPLPKSSTMTREGSFLDSRLSTQSRNGAGVVEISSDEDEVEDENAVRAAGPSKVHSTKPKILTNAKPSREKQKDKEAPAPAPAPAPAIVEQNIKSSPSDTSKPNSMAEVATQSRPTSTIFEEGSVQAKIAQIEKTAETEAGTGGRISPFKPALTLTNIFAADLPKGEDVVIDTVNVNANAQEDEDHDVQMAGPLAVEEGEQVKARPETEASEGAEAKVALPNHSRPAITPPRSQPQQQPPVSPFKTPFRLGPGNPFSVPPTPGVPMELALGVPIPLSKELFIPTRELSDAELNMTVEEWVRHHKQIEYEKFKEDGERKIDTFLRQAEQTRRAIEGL